MRLSARTQINNADLTPDTLIHVAKVASPANTSWYATLQQLTDNIVNAVPNVIDVTYAEITALVGANTLKIGAYYKITDFQTVHTIPNTADINTGAVEPLIIQAVTVNQIAPYALSTLYPSDEIRYELVDSTTAGGTKGRISYRHDTLTNTITYYDWRKVKFRRWETAPASGLFLELTDNGEAFNDYFTFNGLAVEVEIAPITAFGISSFAAPTDKLNNIVFKFHALSSEFENDCFDNTFEAQCVDNYFEEVFKNNIFLGAATGNDFGLDSINNVLGDNYNYNRTGLAFKNNEIGISFQNNIVNNNCESNSIGDNADSNFIVNQFNNNVIGTGFIQNEIESNFQNNTIGVGFVNNKAGQNFQNNEIGDDFANNIIEKNFDDNTIGNSFFHNVIAYSFNSNVVVNGFKYNTIEFSPNIVDFTLATQVYSTYSTRIFKRADGTLRLSYLDATDVVIYTAVNA